MVSRPLDLHPQELLPTVPVPNQEVFLRHKGPSTLIHPQQVGEGLAVAQSINRKSHEIRNDGMMTILASIFYRTVGKFKKLNRQSQSITWLHLTSDLWCLVVHGGDGDVEEKPRDGATMLVTD